MRSKDPCKANACLIQKCLNENSFQESACTDVLEQMRLCCIKWGEKSFVCNGINIEKPSNSQQNTKSTKPNPDLKSLFTMNQGRNQGGRRYPVKKDLPWWAKNPKRSGQIFVTSCMLILFSKPIYDIFLQEPIAIAAGWIQKFKKSIKDS